MADRQLDQQNLVKALNGSPTLLGTITVSANSKTNSSTAVPFTIPLGAMLLLQGDADFYFMPGADTSASASATTAVKVLQDATMTMLLDYTQAYVAVFATGAANVRVFQLK